MNKIDKNAAIKYVLEENILGKLHSSLCYNDIGYFKRLISNLPVKVLFIELPGNNGFKGLDVHSIWHITALKSKSPEFIEALINKAHNSNYQFDIDIPVSKGDFRGCSAYYLAADQQHEKVMELLSIHGATPSIAKPHSPKSVIINNYVIEQFKKDKLRYDVKVELQKLKDTKPSNDKKHKI